jgi:hypothetical protein
MPTEIKMRRYKEIDSILQAKRDYIIKNFSGKISLIKEIIEHSFYLSHLVNTVIFEES